MTALIHISDWLVDAARAVCRLDPLPPKLVRLAVERPPIVRTPARLQVQARRTRHTFLRVEQPGHTLFEGAPPPDGRVGFVPMTPAAIHVQLRLERDPNSCVTVETVFEPLPSGPSIDRFDLPSKVMFGDSLACAWHAPAAERVHLAAIEDGDVIDRIGPPSGQFILQPSRPGRLKLRLTAEASWGQTTVTRTVKIVVPSLRIQLLRPAVQAGHPGETVQFEWRTYGADSVWLLSPGHGEPQLLREKDGLLSVRLNWRPTTFYLVARGHGGAERRAALTAVAQPFASLERN